MPSVRIPTKAERPERAIYGWLYVALVDGRVKVGVTTNCERRRRQIETATGAPVEDWWALWTYSPGAAERFLHRRYDWCRTEGEWFEGGRILFDRIVCYLSGKESKSNGNGGGPGSGASKTDGGGIP